VIRELQAKEAELVQMITLLKARIRTHSILGIAQLRQPMPSFVEEYVQAQTAFLCATAALSAAVDTAGVSSAQLSVHNKDVLVRQLALELRLATCDRSPNTGHPSHEQLCQCMLASHSCTCRE
jgi:hypothetical protein